MAIETAVEQAALKLAEPGNPAISAQFALEMMERQLPRGVRAYLVTMGDSAGQRRLTPVGDDCSVLNIERELISHLNGSPYSDAFLRLIKDYCGERLDERLRFRIEHEKLSGWREQTHALLDAVAKLIDDAADVGERGTLHKRILWQAGVLCESIGESLYDDDAAASTTLDRTYDLQGLMAGAAGCKGAPAEVMAIAAQAVELLDNASNVMPGLDPEVNIAVSNAPAFSDKRVILVRGDDARCATYWDESEAGFEQADDGPTHLVIGRDAPDDKLARLAGRFGFSVEDLKAFRDGKDDAPSAWRAQVATLLDRAGIAMEDAMDTLHLDTGNGPFARQLVCDARRMLDRSAEALETVSSPFDFYGHTVLPVQAMIAGAIGMQDAHRALAVLLQPVAVDLEAAAHILDEAGAGRTSESKADEPKGAE